MGILAKTNGAALVVVMAALYGCNDTSNDAATPGEAIGERTARAPESTYGTDSRPPAGETAARQTDETMQRDVGEILRVNTPVIDSDGNNVGSLTVEPQQQGVRIEMNVEGLAPGPHAVHFHEHGRCDPPDFESAGDHYNPAGARHGMPNSNADPDDQEHHVGDMLNQDADDQGTLNTVMINHTATLADGPASLLAEDGTALIIHERPDDYETQPAGDAGGRVACAVITRAQAEGTR